MLTKTFCEETVLISAAGPIDMDGNRLINVGNPTDPQDTATKFYVHTDKVSKSGDTMTGNLVFEHTPDDTDLVRLLGSTDLPIGKRFSLVFGNTRNRLKFENSEDPRDQTPLTFYTTNGLLVRMNGSEVCHMGSEEVEVDSRRITVYKDISMLEN